MRTGYALFTGTMIMLAATLVGAVAASGGHDGNNIVDAYLVAYFIGAWIASAIAMQITKEASWKVMGICGYFFFFPFLLMLMLLPLLCGIGPNCSQSASFFNVAALVWIAVQGGGFVLLVFCTRGYRR